MYNYNKKKKKVDQKQHNENILPSGQVFKAQLFPTTFSDPIHSAHVRNSALKEKMVEIVYSTTFFVVYGLCSLHEKKSMWFILNYFLKALPGILMEKEYCVPVFPSPSSLIIYNAHLGNFTFMGILFMFSWLATLCFWRKLLCYFWEIIPKIKSIKIPYNCTQILGFKNGENLNSEILPY